MSRLLLVLFLLASIPAISQTTIKVKWINPGLQAQVVPLHGRFISFNKDPGKALEITPDSITARSAALHSTTYDMDYLGHRVLYEEQYGKPFPGKQLLDKLDSLVKPGCENYQFKGKIYRHSIIILFTRHCPKNEDDRIFVHVPGQISYPGGQMAFRQYLQNFINDDKDLITAVHKDSSFYFSVAIKRDSTIGEIKLLEPVSPSKMSDAIACALKQTKGWTPANLGGRDVNIYCNMFIRLRKDGTIEADYKRNY